MYDNRPPDPRFDTEVDRRGTHCEKWDEMESKFGISPDEGLPMWVADTDFRAPQVVQDAVARIAEVGIYGYAGDQAPCRDATIWWMKTRHGWDVTPREILFTHGLVNGAGHVIDALTAPGDAVALFTPIYHAFAAIIRAAGRQVTELPMTLDGDLYTLDFDACEAALTGREKLLLFSSPHNPCGRVWTEEELQGVGAFCRRNDMFLASDEIHHDLLYPGEVHLPMATAVPEITDRLIMMTSASKTFNIAGSKVGSLIVPDPSLRKRVLDRLKPFGLSRNYFGMIMTEAAYSPDGAAWVDDLMVYLDGNRRVFDAGVGAIPGVRSLPLQSTYLSWVDFSGTGMSQQEIKRRIAGKAKIAANSGPEFGTGGEGFMRFNIGLPGAKIAEAVTRLQDAFSDLQ